MFLVVFLIIIILLNQCYILKIEKNKRIYRVEAEWQEYKKMLPNSTLDYAFFGDSHIVDALNPIYINNSFNFGSAGEDYIETYYKIRKIIEKDRIRINNFILQIDRHTLSNKLRTNNRLFMNLMYYSQFIPLNQIAELKEKDRFSLLLEINLPIAGKGIEIIDFFKSPPDLTPITLGWNNRTEDFSLGEKENYTLTRIRDHFIDNDLVLDSINEKSLEYFCKILEIAKENNIKIILIKYPVSKEYDKGLKKNNISIENYYNELFNKINNVTLNYILLDYYDDFFEHLEYFSDPDHLNFVGSEILSKKVAEDSNKDIV